MENVINLIRNMSPREKAYFSKFSKISSSKDKNYLILYEEIIRNNHSTIEEIKQVFEGTTINTYFSSEMNYLFDQVMKSLFNYYMNSNVTFKIIKSIGYIELLLSRAEKEKAKKLLNFTKKSAYKSEQFSIIIKLIDLEEKILFKRGILNFIEKLDELKQERQAVIDKIQNIIQLKVLKEKIRDFQFSHIFLNEPELHREIFTNPLFLDRSNAQSLKAVNEWYKLQVIQKYVVERDFNEMSNMAEKHIQFIEDNLKFFSEKEMFPALSNYLLGLSMSGNHRLFFNALEKLIHLEKAEDLNLKYIEYIKHLRLTELIYRTKNLDYKEKYLSKTYTYLVNNCKYLIESQVDYLFFNTIKCYILFNDFEKAHELINSWFQTGVHEFMLSMARLLRMIIYYEKKLYQLLDSDVQTAYKVLRKRKKYQLLEKIFISFFKKITKSPHKEKQYLKDLTIRLEEVKHNRDENKYLEYFDFYAWSIQKSNK